MFSFVFAIGIFLSVNIILNNGGIVGWIIMGLSAGFLTNLWLKPKRACKRLVMALEMSPEEKYSATFGEDEIEIETLITQEDSEVIDKSQFNITTEELYSMETMDLFLLFVNRALIYTFPKRCLSEQETESLRNYFEEKKI